MGTRQPYNDCSGNEDYKILLLCSGNKCINIKVNFDFYNPI